MPTLKLQLADGRLHRQDIACEEYAHLVQAIKLVCKDYTDGDAEYRDSEGDLCILTEASYPDFLSNSNKTNVWRLQLRTHQLAIGRPHEQDEKLDQDKTDQWQKSWQNRNEKHADSILDRGRERNEGWNKGWKENWQQEGHTCSWQQKDRSWNQKNWNTSWNASSLNSDAQTSMSPHSSTEGDKDMGLKSIKGNGRSSKGKGNSKKGKSKGFVTTEGKGKGKGKRCKGKNKGDSHCQYTGPGGTEG